MSGVVAFIRNCVAAGMDYETALLAAEQFEKAPPVTLGALRQRKYKARKKVEEASPSSLSSPVTPGDAVTQRVPLKLSSEKTPPSPPKGGSVPPVSDLADQVWNLQPARYRRSTRPDIRKALGPVLKSAQPAEILAACRAYYAQPSQTDDDGKYAMGAVRLLTCDRWRDFRPGHDPPSHPVTPQVQARREQHHRDTGEWLPIWGERPETQAA